MSRQIKDLEIAAIGDRIGDASDFIVIDVSRVDAISANRFRIGLRSDNVSALTVRNSFAAMALKGRGVAGLDSLLSGPSTLVWGSEDVVALARCVAKWADEIETIAIKGGTVEGQTLDAGGVEALSKSKGRLETIAELAGLMLAPGAQIAGCMQSPGGQLAGQLKTISEKDEA